MSRTLFLVFTFITCNFFCQENENLISEMSFYKDTSKSLSFSEINNLKFVNVQNNILGLNDAVFWFRIILKKTNTIQPLIFNVKSTSIKNIDIYQNNIKVATKKQDLGLTHYNFKVNNKNNEAFYLKVEFSRQVFFPLSVYYSKNFRNIDKYNFFKSGFYYGFVITIFIINFFFFISLKDKTFLFYCFFLLAINLGISDYDGFSKLWISSKFIVITNVLFHYLIPITGALFATYFLDLKRLYPKSIIIGRCILLLPAISFLIYLTTNSYIFYAIADTLCLLVLLYYWLMGIYVLKTQNFARFFVLGYSLVLFSALFFVIPQDFGFTLFSFSIEHVKFGALFEMLILTFAITYRVKILHQENIKFTEEIKNHINQIFELQEKLIQKKSNYINKSTEEKISNIAEKNNLTERESDILLQIVNGLNNTQIAEKLFISVNTVKYHIRNIYEKLNVNKRTEITTKILFSK